MWLTKSRASCLTEPSDASDRDSMEITEHLHSAIQYSATVERDTLADRPCSSRPIANLRSFDLCGVRKGSACEAIA